MAVAFDSQMTGGNGAGGQDQNIAGALAISSTGLTIIAASILVAVFVWQDNASNDQLSRTATWNGVSMSERATISQVSGATFLRVSIFTLVSPVSGNHALAGAWLGASDCYMSGAGFTGTDTSVGINPADSTTASGTTSIPVTSDLTGATVAVFGANGNPPTVNFNQIFSEAPLNPGGGASYQLSGTTNNHTFTGAGGTLQALAGIHIIAAAATQTFTLMGQVCI
jgi:hypothetical protein